VIHSENGVIAKGTDIRTGILSGICTVPATEDIFNPTRETMLRLEAEYLAAIPSMTAITELIGQPAPLTRHSAVSQDENRLPSVPTAGTGTEMQFGVAKQCPLAPLPPPPLRSPALRRAPARAGIHGCQLAPP